MGKPVSKVREAKLELYRKKGKIHAKASAGRFTTLRSWLSQWSYDESRANGVVNAGRISCPVLVVNNTADLACTPSHARRLYDAVASADKSYTDIQGADHYYADTPELLPMAVKTVCDWLNERSL